MNYRLAQRIAKREDDRDRWEENYARQMEMVGWLQEIAPWQVIMHGTWAWEASIWSAQRCFEKFMRLDYPRVSYFYALEPNPGRDGFHVHALFADAGNVHRKEMWSKWHQRYGRARIEPVRSQADVTDYHCKYVTKKDSWWGVKLQWHRIQALNNTSFVLRDACSAAVA